MSTAFERFGELETRVLRAVELLRTTRQEKEVLEKQLIESRAVLTRMEREVEELRRERDVIKNKVEALLENLSELSEETSAQTEVASHRS